MTKIPTFKSEREESDFWDTHDTTDYFDESEEIEATLVDARPKTLIALHFTSDIIDRIREVADKQGLNYRSMVHEWVRERLAQETGLSVEELFPKLKKRARGIAETKAEYATGDAEAKSI